MLKPVQTQVDPVSSLVLRSVGYGAHPEGDKHLSKAQKRLMAIRASRLDAYRAMAEQVYGMSLHSNTTVRDIVAKNDGFKTAIDAFIHGVRVVSAEVMFDGSVETVLEMAIDSGFRNCLKTTNHGRTNVDCQAGLNPNNRSSENMDEKRTEIANQGRIAHAHLVPHGAIDYPALDQSYYEILVIPIIPARARPGIRSARSVKLAMLNLCSNIY